MDEVIIQGKRAIAYFDILGFKNRINNTPFDILSATYEKLIKNTDGEFAIMDGIITNKQVCFRYVFSDSLFLVAKEDTEESFIDMLSYAWRMMQLFIASGFPLRGAVTYGEIYANIEKSIFLGKAISEAVILEAQQDWIGAVVDLPVINRYEAIFKRDDILSIIMNVILPIHDVPFKDGTCKDYHVINWRQNMISEDGIKALFKNEPFDENVQKKINNTLRFSKEVVDAHIAYFNDNLVPEKYRRFYIGHKVPSGTQMFTNGDEY